MPGSAAGSSPRSVICLRKRRIAQIGQIDLVELQIAAAGIGESAHRLAIGLAEIAIKIVHRRIELFRHHVAAVAEMQRRRRGDRQLRRLFGVRLQKLEMLDHRMRLVAAELADDAQQDRPRLRPGRGKLDLALADIGLDVVEPFEKVIVPGDAPVLAVGRRFEPDHLLLADDALDLAVFDRPSARRR